MPLLIPIKELQPGMKLHEALLSNGRVLLQGGRVLAASDITSLRRRCPNLNVRIEDSLLDDAIEFEDDSYDRDVANTIQQMVAESVSQVQNTLTERISRKGAEHASLGAAELNTLQTALAGIMQFLRDNPTSAALITECLDADCYLSAHAGNVLHLSMLLGSTLMDYVADERNRQTVARELKAGFIRDLTPLGLGAMAMDLGLVPLQNLLETDEPLSEADQQAVRKHPTVGAEMLPENTPALTRMVVRTHHENFDGTGYPDAIPGENLHVFTRIVRIADAYDAATSKGVYKGSKSTVRALWEMLAGPYRSFYDPKLMASFAKLIQPFPIGSRLHLVDGRYAVVVKYNLANPFRPIVVVAFDEQNNPIPRAELESPVELASHSGLRIKSFRGEDLSYIYDTESGGNAKPRTGFATMLEAAYP